MSTGVTQASGVTAVPGSSTTGTISSITSTGGSISVTNPGGPTTNIEIAASGVAAGSYTNTSLTVNAQGIITAASSGADELSGTSGSIRGTALTVGTAAYGT